MSELKNIEKTIDSLFIDMESVKHHRGRSWEHCYKFFRDYQRFRESEGLLDHAALHLGFFLASWGMLRGSSFLLQKDYKIYVPIVRVLTKPVYYKLWDIDFSDRSKREVFIKQLFNLKKDLMGAVERKDHPNNPGLNDLQVTKIIMATLGCTPAYDTNFKKGLEKYEIKPRTNFSERSFGKLLNCCDKHREFYEIKKYINGTQIRYPTMKLLDMYFWKVGEEEMEEKKRGHKSG